MHLLASAGEELLQAHLASVFAAETQILSVQSLPAFLCIQKIYSLVLAPFSQIAQDTDAAESLNDTKLTVVAE